MNMDSQRKHVWRIALLALTAFAFSGACGARQDEPKQEKNDPPQASAGPRIATIVFVDQESCCDCTRERQEATWRNLQAALNAMDSPPTVEVVHLDTQAEDAQLYIDLKPIMVSPGLYFFDGAEVLAEMLQGELSREKIEDALE